VTFEDTSSSLEVRDYFDPVAESGTLHLEGISKDITPGESLAHNIKGVCQEANANTVEARISEKNGSEKSINTDVKKRLTPSQREDANLYVKNKSSPRSDITVPIDSDKLPFYSAGRADHVFLRQNPALREGTVRRKIMRTVSQDDYLLARGANPRTGVVTPSIHSGSSSIDDSERLRIREMATHAKWRLKGDEWVSLGLDEPSPLPSNPSELSVRGPGGLLRIPPKLAQRKQTKQKQWVDDFEQLRFNDLKVMPDKMARLHQTGQPNRKGFPSSETNSSHIQAPAFAASLLPRHNEGCFKDTIIRRKPLGTPPGRPSVERLFQSNEVPDASTETVIIKTKAEEHIRSSSMPTQRKLRFFKPEDVGKALPALPGPKTSSDDAKMQKESPSQGMPFLGPRKGDWIEDVSMSVEVGRQDPGRVLPCLPTNDSQSRFHPSETVPVKNVSASKVPMHTNKLEIQRRRVDFPPRMEGRSSGHPRSRPMIPPRHCQLAPGTQPAQISAQFSALRSSGPSLPASDQTRPQGCSTSLNGQMKMRSSGTKAGSDAQTSQSTITPTTILQTAPEDRLVSSSWREMPSPLRPGRQRASPKPRPAMPERAEATHNVQQVSPQKELPERYQWRMTGMSDSEVSANSTSVEGSPERDLLPRPLRPSNGNARAPGALTGVAARSIADAGRLAKNCPHCKNCALGVSQHDMDGSIHRQGNHLAENVDPRTDLSLASGFLQGTPEDHSGCCPDCCAVGCHGSCLGHRSPSMIGPTSGVAGSLGAIKDSFRNSMRFSRRTRVRTSAGGLRETETEEFAELETPMSWEVNGPVSLGLPSKISPESFWGGSRIKNGSQEKRIASNAPASSMKTLDMPPNLGFGAIVEAFIVPFGALRMWLKKHPQLSTMMQAFAARLLGMTKHVLETTGKTYRVAYIYSKTGKISPGKNSSLGGLARDCARAAVYCLILGAVAMMMGRVLAVVAGAGSWLIWTLSWFVWILKAVGLGILW
jgi:hypothetical protein